MSTSALPRFPRAHLSTSVCTVLHTLPWLGIYLGKIPSVVKPMLLLQENGRQMAKARLERGSKTRDLYHYLASSSSCVMRM